MDRIFQTSASALALIALAACSGGPSGNTPPSLQELDQIGLLAEDDVTRIRGDSGAGGIPGTAFEQVPDEGTATFTGPGLVSVFTREESPEFTEATTSVVSMFGTASVTIDFEAGEFDGSVTDLVAGNQDFETDFVDGELALDGETTGFNDLTGAATGALTAFGETYNLAIDVEGKLRGTNPNVEIPVRAINLEGESPIAETDLLSGISIVGDKVGNNASGAFINR